jgi:hypothetical protein
MTSAQEFSVAVQEYLREYKKLPKEERARIAREHLIEEGVLDENGEFTDHYAYSREYYKNKNKKNSRSAGAV